MKDIMVKLEDIALDVACLLDENPDNLDYDLLQRKIDNIINLFEDEEVENDE